MKLLPTAAVLTFALIGLSQGALNFYTESFTNSGSNTSHAAKGWSAHEGSGAVDFSSNTNSPSDGTWGIAPSSGAVSGTGYAAKVSTGSFAMAWTQEFTPLNRSLTEISDMSVYTSNSDPNESFRFAIRLDTTWYVTDASFTQTSDGPDNFATLHTFTFTTNGNAWRPLDFTPGSTLALDTFTVGGTLPTDNLTAAGIYIESNTGIIRYDEFKINTVPEPTSVTLLSSLVALSFLRRRR